jgi:hypothetical protein
MRLGLMFRSSFATARCVQGAAHGRIGGGIGFIEARPCFLLLVEGGALTQGYGLGLKSADGVGI